MDGNQTVSGGMRVTYAQDWSSYNAAQTQEGQLFTRLLTSLCANVEHPTYRFGRPTLPLADIMFSSALKVYSTFSLRRFVSLMQTAKKEGHIDKVCSYSTVSNYMRKPELTTILKDLITKSSLALKSIETEFAIDSTGFSTSQFDRWFSFKYGKNMDVRKFLKMHVVCGVKTNIVTSVEITEGNASDCRQFETLVTRTAEHFEINELSADKAYSSRANNELVNQFGGIPFIAFKENAKARAGGSSVWKKMYHYWNLHRDEFLQHYHKRSNAESTMNMIKAKFGSRLRSKDKTAQVNELLLKVLCHNICVVIQEMYELGDKLNS